MLTQEELDKLLAQGPEGSENLKDEDKQGPGKTGGSQGPETAEPSHDNLDWSQAFAEAAAGGDAAAAKAVKNGIIGQLKKPASAPEYQEAQRPQRPKFDEFKQKISAQNDSIGKPDLDFILDIPLEISVELGRTRLQIRDLLQLGQGSIISLDKLAGEPADIYVNQKLMAKGDVVVVNEKFGIKLTEIISPADRVKNLGSQKY
ncbi:MAG: flagellar motor switch protein FliN [Dissulfurimicrobium sp.]